MDEQSYVQVNESTARTPASEMRPDADATPPPPTSDMPTSVVAAATVSPDQIKLQRLADYQALALHDADPLLASIGALNGSMIYTSQLIQRFIERDIVKSFTAGASLNGVLPTLDVQLRLARQIDRYCQFMLRVTKSREAAVSILDGPLSAKPKSLLDFAKRQTKF